MGADDQWGSRDPGPVVRPYALTGGRTEPAGGEILDLIAVVVASPLPADTDAPVDIRPEHRKILSLCLQPITVADLASDTTLPIGVMRVLLADLTQDGRVTVLPQRPVDEQPSTDLLKEVLHGLRAL